MAKKSGILSTAVSIGLVTAGAVGAYFMYGKDAKKNRKKVRSWALKARAEALEKIEKLKNIDKASYEQAIDEVLKRYEKVKDASVDEISKLGRELKSHWREIQKEFKPKVKKKK